MLQVRKKSKVENVERRIVGPPEYPYAYYRLKENEECQHCGGVGEMCHNIRYGLFLSAALDRFYCQNRSTYNDHDATRFFVETYHLLTDYEDFLDDATIQGEVDYSLPECVTMDALVFA